MKKHFTLILLLAGLMTAMAQIDEVTLVVSGEGATKDEATTKALRSAIEQAFGVFVSANTEILNDELVKDEIATVSSGNIKSYKELGTITKDNGNTVVSLQAIVSPKMLTSYAKSHGSSCELDGATFNANMKLIKLNQLNTEKAFENLNKQLSDLGDLVNCDIEVGTIRSDGTVDVKLKYYANENGNIAANLIISTLKALDISGEERKKLKELRIPIYGYDLGVDRNLMKTSDGFYAFFSPLNLKCDIRPFKIFDNFDICYDMICIYKYDYQGHTYGEHCPQFEWWNKTGYYIHEEEYKDNHGLIIIPGAFRDGIAIFKKSSKSKSQPQFTPKLLCEINGIIRIPTEKIEKITNLYAKSPDHVGYYDLGLPSGTLWEVNEAKGQYTYDEAVSQFGKKLPTKEQLEELRTKCEWIVGSSYFTVVGSGGFFHLPAQDEGRHLNASYLSSTVDRNSVWCLFINNNYAHSAGETLGYDHDLRMLPCSVSHKFSVRLVKE